MRYNIAVLFGTSDIKFMFLRQAAYRQLGMPTIVFGHGDERIIEKKFKSDSIPRESDEFSVTKPISIIDISLTLEICINRRKTLLVGHNSPSTGLGKVSTDIAYVIYSVRIGDSNGISKSGHWF